MKTKKPKHVTIEYVERKSTVATYVCPSCHVHATDYCLGKTVIRFYCSCGQELIVDNCSPDPKSCGNTY